MPTVEILTDPDTRPGGDPMKERLLVNFTSPPTSPPSSPHSPRHPTPRLAKVNDELLFEAEDAIKTSGRIHIKNISVPSSTLVFKIKTTNPGKFHVWPTIGLIADRGSAVSKVTIKPNVKPKAVLNDKFQVEVMVVPRDLLGQIQSIEEDDQEGNLDSPVAGSSKGNSRRSSLAGEPGHSVSTLAELNSAWRVIAMTGAQAETHKVAVVVESRLLEEPSGPPSQPPPTPTLERNSSECAERIQQLELRLDSLDNDIMEQFSYVQILMYSLIALLVAVTVLNIASNGNGNFWENAQQLARIPLPPFIKDHPVGKFIQASFENSKIDQDQVPPMTKLEEPKALPMEPKPLPPPLLCSQRSILRAQACPLFG